ncbi:MAG: tRNA (adenosine(37)-N6)-threonylcarbamoyltransferase complex ATPase subunit type 1 TsaE [Alphaproteobacteria bacterium]|nr:tRNA (adenosine(37)-N6)-threonylcarbamoyltransferase complex ATPase subunit type 1 TsaE [Alphaproteobacteria bacterium]MDE1930122.1 tRNA (adenosine(37)-N6)-threonylcarbamoyltransferase complex ATPase subunit type 1 TsaE [Alphaproteobacteria bacterium]
MGGGAALVLALADEAATGRFAARLARLARRGDVITLRGELGSGKTTFARAFVRARLGESLEVPSPTFTLVEIYDGGDSAPAIWHFDLFRLNSANEARELGFEEALADDISLIEWPERLGTLLPAERLALTFAAGPTRESRSLTVEPSTSWRDRIEELSGG